MGESIAGTIIAAQITTGNTDNTFSIGDTNQMQGGHHQVADLVERDAITTERRREGMLCYVISNSPNPSADTDPSVIGGALYRLVGGITNDHWVEVSLSGSSGTSGTSGSSGTSGLSGTSGSSGSSGSSGIDGASGSSGTSGTSSTGGAINLDVTEDNMIVKTIYDDPSAGEDGALEQTGIRIDDDNNLILLAGTKLILDG